MALSTYSKGDLIRMVHKSGTIKVELESGTVHDMTRHNYTFDDSVDPTELTITDGSGNDHTFTVEDIADAGDANLW